MYRYRESGIIAVALKMYCDRSTLKAGELIRDGNLKSAMYWGDNALMSKTLSEGFRKGHLSVRVHRQKV